MKDTTEDLVRIWFSAVRDAADAGEREIRDVELLSQLQRALLRILIRQDLCDFLSLSIRSAEDIGADAANRIKQTMYSELMEDAIAGIWSEEENLKLVHFLSLCAEGIGDTETYCEYFFRALGGEDGSLRRTSDAIAKRVKETAAGRLDVFIKARKEQCGAKSRSRDDEPPPWMDEFEYIDWAITH